MSHGGIIMKHGALLVQGKRLSRTLHLAVFLYMFIMRVCFLCSGASSEGMEVEEVPCAKGRKTPGKRSKGVRGKKSSLGGGGGKGGGQMDISQMFAKW